MKLPHIKGFDQDALQKYFKNTGWLILARVGSLLIKVLVGFAIANYLGRDQNGLLNYPQAFVAFFIAAAALGLDGFTTRELLKHPEKKNELLGTSFRLKLIGGLTAMPLIYIGYLINQHFFTATQTPLHYILIIGLSGVTQAFYITDSYFQATVQAKYVTFTQVFGNIFSAAIKLLLILTHAELFWFIWAIFFDTVILAFGYLYFYQKKVGGLSNWKYDKNVAKHLLSNSWPLAFSAILVSLYMKIDQLMVDSFLGSGQLGVYSTVVQLSESWYFIPVAIVTSVFPAIMNAKRDDPARYQKRLQNMYDLMVWMSLSIAIITTFISPLAYRIIYKEEFWSGAHVLSVHIWAGIFVFLGSASGQYLIAEGYTKISLMRTAVGAIVNIALNIYLIPKYGIMGAAVATLAAYFVATFLIILIPKTHKQGLMMLKSLFLVTVFQKIIKR
ncbi:flippase [Pedobacter xixiisoli]|uniref:Membrane protein involved in the export of O-antigen and teichoic acid n=1 Tax=Pedobacter xixiisoli TaxID=1476464 RepID=A0A286ACU3_9SPHI|nr:flippase [Pedobacter xixiisoli]SOD19730.1 Membrane protein involved in the export of O-antigen and teichoic acid [Pedobacter xixiisoli]